MSSSVPTFYNAWFCPFAQRAWIALLEKGIAFDYIEQDPYKKTPEWLLINPRGLVPVIVHNGKSVYDSPVCIEYVDETWKTGSSLLPSDTYQRAYVRIWSNFISSSIVPPFYQLLMKREHSEREQAKEALLKGLMLLFAELDENAGPFFGGKSLNLVDIMLFPFAYRFQVVLSHYRDIVIPTEGAEMERYYRWYTAAKDRDSVKKTLSEDAKLVSSYQTYADDSANSLVAEAIRKGTAIP